MRIHGMRSWAWGALVLVGLLWTSGCSDHEKAVRERAKQLMTMVVHNDMEGCVTMTDPVFVRAQGKDAVKLRFGWLSLLVSFGKLTDEDLRIDSIKVGDDKKSATVYISIHDKNKNQWNAGKDPIRWVLEDGVWYVAM